MARRTLDVVVAVRAFRDLTGELPTGKTPDVQIDAAWRVFTEAVRCVLEPTAAREAWLAKAAKPFYVTEGVKKARLVRELLRRCSPDGGFANVRPDGVRRILVPYDPAFGKLTDEQIRRAQKAKGIYTQIARLALAVEALGATRLPHEDEAAAVRRVATAYRKATERGEKAG